MSDEENQELDGEGLVAAAIEAEDEPVEEEAAAFDYDAKQEEKAARGGWKPLEDWVAAGRDPEEWSDAKTFNVRGEFISKLRAKDEELDSTVANLNKFHKTQLEMQRTELIKERDAAIAKGGEGAVNAVKDIDYQLSQLNEPIAPPAQDNTLVQEWESKNPWINEPGAKSVYAQTLFGQAKQAGMTVAKCIEHVNSGLAKEFPPESKPTDSIAEGGSRPSGNKAPSRSLTMSDLTAEEKAIREITPGAWKSDEDFLKAVQASRK